MNPRHFPLGQQQEFIATQANLQIDYLQQIAPRVQHSISSGYYPGAVILAGRRDHIIYRGVFGHQQMTPEPVLMSADTIFDAASLTKVIVTTTAIMQLVEQGKLKLDACVAEYWPEFTSHHKNLITVRELLTHTTGLPAGLGSPELNEVLPLALREKNPRAWRGKASALQQVLEIEPNHPHGTHYLYSDINFIILGHLVEIIAQQSLDVYAAQYIFQPLRMTDTTFLPNKKLRSRIAPTEMLSAGLRWGEVHDPTTLLMGGVAGMAGMFTTAKDLGIYAQTILNQGCVPDQATYLMQPQTLALMTARQEASVITDIRALGWDKNSSHACRGKVLSPAAFGHTGWTGTSLWIDPLYDVWLVILTSRTHPTPWVENKLVADRGALADLVVGAVAG